MRPERREDGKCIDCETRFTVTSDGRLCWACLKKRSKQDTPAPRHYTQPPDGRRSSIGSGFGRSLLCALVAICLWAGSTLAVEITGESKVGSHRIVRLGISGDAKNAAIIWDIDREDLCDVVELPGRLLFTAPAGTYKVKARIVRLVDGAPSIETARLTVTIGGAPTPGPGPEPTPTPTPAPITGDGFRVLIIEESGSRAKLPAAQLAILFSREVRDYLRSRCVKDKDNPVGAWRIWDKDSDATEESKSWQEALKRKRESIPWVVISDGKSGYEGPLPATIAEMMALLRKWGG